MAVLHATMQEVRDLVYLLEDKSNHLQWRKNRVDRTVTIMGMPLSMSRWELAQYFRYYGEVRAVAKGLMEVYVTFVDPEVAAIVRWRSEARILFYEDSAGNTRTLYADTTPSSKYLHHRQKDVEKKLRKVKGALWRANLEQRLPMRGEERGDEWINIVEDNPPALETLALPICRTDSDIFSGEELTFQAGFVASNDLITETLARALGINLAALPVNWKVFSRRMRSWDWIATARGPCDVTLFHPRGQSLKVKAWVVPDLSLPVTGALCHTTQTWLAHLSS